MLTMSQGPTWMMQRGPTETALSRMVPRMWTRQLELRMVLGLLGPTAPNMPHV